MEPITLLNDKRIVLGVTGSIAVYKAIDLASKLTQAGAMVDVIMTEAAQKFVTPLAFQAVTGRAVYTDMWASGGSALPTHIAHVGLGEGADLLIIAPITANSIAKLAQGLADDLLVAANGHVHFIGRLAFRFETAAQPLEGAYFFLDVGQLRRHDRIGRLGKQLRQIPAGECVVRSCCCH